MPQHDGIWNVYRMDFLRKESKGIDEPYGNEKVKQYYHYRADSENGSGREREGDDDRHKDCL